MVAVAIKFSTKSFVYLETVVKWGRVASTGGVCYRIAS